MNILVVSNELSGLSDNTKQIKNSLQTLGRNHQVSQISIKQALDSNLVKQDISSHNYDTIVAIGGDGTVSLCANLALRYGLKLGIIPTGTFNHFAKHIGISKDIEESFKILENQSSQLVDVGILNGTSFVNFASIGFYADMIKNREKLQANGFQKWVGFIKALFSTNYFPHKLRISSKISETKEKGTALLFVGNGSFDFGSIDMLNERTALDTGQLQLVTLEDYRRIKLLFIAFLSMFIDLKNHLGFHSVLLHEFKVKTKYTKKLTVVVDGEVKKFNTPLDFSKKIRALRVICPD